MTSEITEFLDFYYAKFINQQPSIEFDGDVSVSAEGALRFTKDYGRAPHKSPVQIWDNTATSNVASFFTCFSFSIYTQDVEKTKDTLSFFLEKPDSKGETDKQTVRVELHNDMDDHSNYQNIVLKIGEFEYKAQWIFENAEKAILYASYDYPTKKLKATCFYPGSGKIYPVTASYVNYLKNVLPMQVRAGFDARNSNSETGDVNSWYFASAYGATAFTLAEPLIVLNPDLAAYLDRHFGA